MTGREGYEREHFGQPGEPARFFNAVLKPGTRFVHRRFLDGSTGLPLLCVVTKRALGVVYYRPDYGLHDDGTPWLGSPYYFPAEDAWKYVDSVKS